MKKKIAFFLVILLTGIILYATLVTRVYEKEIPVKAPLLKIHNQISNAGYIAKWYASFSHQNAGDIKISDDKISSAASTLTIIKLDGLSSLFKVDENGKSLKVRFTVNGDTGLNHTIKLDYKNTLWNEIFGGSRIAKNAEKSLEGLRDYIEDTKITYGYKITVTEVTDTTFLFSSKVVATSNKKEKLKELYQSLIDYSAAKNAGYNGTRILYLMPEGKDSTRLYASIGITSNTENMPLNGSIALRRMPYKRNLIIAAYKDRFGKISDVFNAMEQYRVDNSMTSMAIPFIKLITPGIEFDDDQVIEAKGFLPVL